MNPAFITAYPLDPNGNFTPVIYQKEQVELHFYFSIMGIIKGKTYTVRVTATNKDTNATISYDITPDEDSTRLLDGSSDFWAAYSANFAFGPASQEPTQYRLNLELLNSNGELLDTTHTDFAAIRE